VWNSAGDPGSGWNLRQPFGDGKKENTAKEAIKHVFIKALTLCAHEEGGKAGRKMITKGKKSPTAGLRLADPMRKRISRGGWGVS